ncbi:MAG: ArsR/SmtB family transcription factor [Hyphomicrobiaceae bacterium]
MSPREAVAALKAAAEPTRLRILLLLAGGELNVKDLTEILRQSQPRVSRHLKLLTEAGLIERAREGSWVYFRIADDAEGGALVRHVLHLVAPDDPAILRDRDRAEVLKRQREQTAQTYFDAHAADWDRIRTLHVPEAAVEREILDLIGPGPFELLVDLGTGTGRILELLSPRYRQAVGFDVNHSMLAYARSKLSAAGLDRAHVRHGDLYALPLADGAADAVVMHQVLHFMSEPSRAIAEAARVLRPGGRLIVIDFAPHGLEFLREQFAHERLGFSGPQIEEWLAAAGMTACGVRTLEPETRGGPEQLTVSIWVGERMLDARRGRGRQSSSELQEANDERVQ